jgi:hypothetical protein
MSTILVDRIGSVLFHHGILRVNCIANGPNSEDHATGNAAYPCNQMPAVMKSLLNAVKEVDQRMRDQLQKVAAAKVTPPANSEEAVAQSAAGPKSRASN